MFFFSKSEFIQSFQFSRNHVLEQFLQNNNFETFVVFLLQVLITELAVCILHMLAKKMFLMYNKITNLIIFQIHLLVVFLKKF